MADPKHIVRTGAYDWSQVPFRGRHPFNDLSEMSGFSPSRLTGLKRAHVNMLRVPPGKESYIPHAHGVEEEWVYVVEGQGVVALDDETYPIGPGDFIGFPVDGVVHSVKNTGATDLTYLTGGERADVEVVKMPTLGKTAVMTPAGTTFYDTATAEFVSSAEWGRKAQLPAKD